jgi:hypothetical protein
MATYRVIADLFLPGCIYASAGEILSDGPGGKIPVGWVPPTGAVDPIDAAAIAAYQAVGPQGQDDAEPNRWNAPWGWSRWSGVTYAPAVHYWRNGVLT